nr:hypothetical protein [Longimonas halophila]
MINPPKRPALQRTQQSSLHWAVAAIVFVHVVDDGCPGGALQDPRQRYQFGVVDVIDRSGNGAGDAVHRDLQLQASRAPAYFWKRMDTDAIHRGGCVALRHQVHGVSDIAQGLALPVEDARVLRVVNRG